MASNPQQSLWIESGPPTDSTSSSNDSLPPKDEDVVGDDRQGDPISNPPSKSPLEYEPPSNVKKDVEPSDDLGTYTVTEKVGDLDYRAPSEMTFEEFAEYQKKKRMQQQWKDLQPDAGKGAGAAIPLSWQVKSPKGEPIVDIKPSGNVTISLGGRWSRTENPAIPVNLQRNGGLEFDQQIALNLLGTVGERLNIAANWNTKATFDFDNNIKISYKGKDEDILKELQAGNVSLPINNTLITGAQNLFGIKARLQFGRLHVTGLLSRQRGQSQTITIRGGGQTRPFDKRVSEYDEYKHYFLSHFFKKRFNQAFEQNPFEPNTGFRITRLEVWKTNVTSTTQDLRNIIGFQDLGENGTSVDNDNETGFLQNQTLGGTLVRNPDNNSNSLYKQLIDLGDGFRNIDQALTSVSNTIGLNDGEYQLVTSAKKLELGRDYDFNENLGYFSLRSQVQENEALAIAFEYTYNGQQYKVGELTEDLTDVDNSQVIALKLIKPQNVPLGTPMWDLMMKNIYSVGASNLKPDNFQMRVVYKDDNTGIDNPSLQEGGKDISGVPLLQLLGMDKFNQNNDLVTDGNFDFLDGYTVNTKRGLVVFPKREPFGSDLRDVFYDKGNGNELYLENKYVYQALYDTTKGIANQLTSKDKFFLSGAYQTSSSTEIALPGLNIAEGSVRVVVGSNSLVEGRDFTVNYSLGRVRITNEGVLASGQDIKISFEKADLFGFRQKSLIGTRLDYKINEDINIGATVLHLSERPFVTRVNIGDEPLKNTQVGLDVKYSESSRLITKMVDALPLIQTKATSNISTNFEVAALIPGNSKVIGEEGTSYIDDFEGAETPYSFGSSPQTWRVSSTPRRFSDDWSSDTLNYTYHRAKLNWYTIDQSFFGGSEDGGFSLPEGEKPDSDNGVNHYVRSIVPQEIFPQQSQQQITINTNTFDMMYYPQLRGVYNYNANQTEVAPSGEFLNPRDNWAGIVRPIKFENDFNKANVEYIEFWMMNPFHTSDGGTPDLDQVLPDGVQKINDASQMGGKMYFNLGDVREDVVKDNRHAFENGLPDNVVESKWGKVTTQPFITNAFDNSGDRSSQDVGLDGISSTEEREQTFSKFVEAMQNPYFNQGAEKVVEAQIDPSSDDYSHYVEDDGDSRGILTRYFNYNGMENNSPIDNSGSFPKSNYTTPDNEDVNDDKTISFDDNYFEYELDLKPKLVQYAAVDGDGNPYTGYGLDVESNPFIVDRVNTRGVDWYQVRIPIRQNYQTFGNIAGFSTIKFFRMYMTDFEKPVMIRMAQLQLVASQWRRTATTQGSTFGEPVEPDDDNFTIGTVNIEENSQGVAGVTSPYVIPPGTVRDQDQTSNNQQQLNEQSLFMSVEGLADGQRRSVFKNQLIDMISYKKLKLFVHAETSDLLTQDRDLQMFVRIGTDLDENYYEVAVPLFMSNVTSNDANEVWRAENEIDVVLKDLIETKTDRDAAGVVTNARYSKNVGKYVFTVKGRPDLTTVQTMRMGIYNPTDDGVPKSARVWVNELRVSDFKKQVGWASTGSVNVQLADLGSVTASGRYTSAGYGGIETRIAERERANTTQYGVATNLTMDKFLPKKFITLPLYMSYDKKLITPQYDPYDQDVEFKTSLENKSESEREEYKKKVTYEKTTRSIQLTSVKLVKTKENPKKHFYDPHNITLGAGFTEEKETGTGNPVSSVRGNSVALFLNQTYQGSAAYNYSFKQKNLEPFKKSKLFKGKYLTLIKDVNFNPVPSSIAIKGDLNRNYKKTQLYNNFLTTEGVSPTYEKRFFFNRTYNARWGITKSINFSYNATAQAIVDEPLGDKNGDATINRAGYVASKRQYRDSLIANILDLGRMKNFNQTLNASYKIPLHKIPLFSWTKTDVRYSAGYNWNAGPVGLADTLGNTISNNNNISVNTRLNFTRLYSKSKILKKINSRYIPRERVVTDTAGNKITLPARPELKGLKAAGRFVTMVKNISGSYTQTNNTSMSGFLGTPKYAGLGTDYNQAPGIPFILGSQDIDRIRGDISESEWLSKSRSLNTPLAQMFTEKVSIKASLEPFRYLRVNATIDYSKSKNYTENIVFNDTVNQYESRNGFLGGSIKMSFLSIRTAFVKDAKDNSNAVFKQFSKNRDVYQAYLNSKRGAGEGGFDKNSQNVLIPAFLAAYSGKKVSSDPSGLSDKSLSPHPKIPLPNWRVDYSGLSKIKKIKKRFSSINLTHSYKSEYSVGNFSSSLLYTDINPSTSFNPNYSILDTNDNGSIVPDLIISQVTIRERFAPLIGVTMNTKKRMNIRVSYDKSRNLTLNMSNAQVTEERNNDIKFGLGFTKKGLPKVGKQKRPLLNLDKKVTYKIDFTVRDTKTVQRTLESETQEENNVVTNGNLSLRLQPTINYEFSRRMNAQLYFDRTINAPKISSSFRRTTTAFGVRIRFSLI